MCTGSLLAYIRAFAFLEKAEIQGDLEISPPTSESQGHSHNNLKDQPFQKSALEHSRESRNKGGKNKDLLFFFPLKVGLGSGENSSMEKNPCITCLRT